MRVSGSAIGALAMGLSACGFAPPPDVEGDDSVSPDGAVIDAAVDATALDACVPTSCDDLGAICGSIESCGTVLDCGRCVAFTYANATPYVLRAAGGGFGKVWSAPEAPTSFGYSYGVAWGDADGDGDLDLAIGGDPAELRIYEQRASTFTLLWRSEEAEGPQHVGALAWGDLDGDGVDELVVGSNAETVRVCRRVTNGGFDCDPLGTETGSASEVLLWDQEGDGDPDLFVARYGASALFYRNDGGQLATSPTWDSEDVTLQATGAAIGRIDGDDALDVVVSDYGDVPAVFLSAGDDDPAFVLASMTAPVIASASDVEIADVDADGRNDVLVANDRERTIVLRNTAGQLNEVVQPPATPAGDCYAFDVVGAAGALTIACATEKFDGVTEDVIFHQTASDAFDDVWKSDAEVAQPFGLNAAWSE